MSEKRDSFVVMNYLGYVEWANFQVLYRQSEPDGSHQRLANGKNRSLYSALISFLFQQDTEISSDFRIMRVLWDRRRPPF